MKLIGLPSLYSDSKESACIMGDPGFIPGWGRSPGAGNLPTQVFLPGEQSIVSQRVRHD